MNERIHDLVDITAEQHPGVYNLVYEDGSKGVEFNEVALEYLAELIVRECVGLCLKQIVGSVGTYPGAHNNAVGKCINAIKDNFGVE
jgi:hypothetical protein